MNTSANYVHIYMMYHKIYLLIIVYDLMNLKEINYSTYSTYLHVKA